MAKSIHCTARRKVKVCWMASRTRYALFSSSTASPDLPVETSQGIALCLTSYGAWTLTLAAVSACCEVSFQFCCIRYQYLICCCGWHRCQGLVTFLDCQSRVICPCRTGFFWWFHWWFNHYEVWFNNRCHHGSSCKHSIHKGKGLRLLQFMQALVSGSSLLRLFGTLSLDCTFCVWSMVNIYLSQTYLVRTHPWAQLSVDSCCDMSFNVLCLNLP